MPEVRSEAFQKPDPQFLSSKRLIADPFADAVVQKIITSGYEEKVNEVFMSLVTNAGYSPDHFSELPQDLREIVIEYFRETSQLPSWADSQKIKLGEEIFAEFGPEVFMLLNVKSLPMCYTCAKGAKVLYDTGRLTEHGGNIDPLARRLMETAQMIINVMSPGGLSSNGDGLVTLQKVRLIHASIRYFLKHPRVNKNGWDVATYGEPINQEDLAGTLMSFGPIILSGLDQLNIKLTEQQIDAYMHCWKVVGYIMGIQDDLLPDSYDQGWELTVAILKHQAASSDEGKALTESCINFMRYVAPGNLFDDVPPYMIGFFFQDVSRAVGKDLATMIGVEAHESFKDKVTLLLTRLITGTIGKLEHHEIIRKLTGRFNRILLQGFLKHYNGGKDVHFFIPPSLQKDWKLTEVWEDKAQLTPNLFGNRLMWQQRKEKL